MRLELFLNKEVPSQNVRERWHWTAQRAEVRAWHRLAALAAGHGCEATGKRSLHVVAYRRRRIRDEANLIGGCKGLIDGLVRCGLLLDDSRQVMTATYEERLASQSPTRKPGVFLTLEDVQ